MSRLIVLIFGLCVVAGAPSFAGEPEGTSVSAASAITALADRYYEFRLRTQPEIAYFSGVELKQHDGLTDNSPAGQQAIAREEDEL